jgi:hypothetical protein
MIRPDFLRVLGHHFAEQLRRADRRRPPHAGEPQPAVPPRGPLPLEGGAEAPLD